MSGGVFPVTALSRQLFDVYLPVREPGEEPDRPVLCCSRRNRHRIEMVGYEKIKEHLSNGTKGMIFLTAHVGNWQVSMTALRNLGRTVHLMMRPEDNAAVKEALNIDSEQGYGPDPLYRRLPGRGHRGDQGDQPGRHRFDHGRPHLRIQLPGSVSARRTMSGFLTAPSAWRQPPSVRSQCCCRQEQA